MKIKERLMFLPREQEDGHMPNIFDAMYGIAICIATLVIIALYHSFEVVTTLLLSCMTFFLFMVWGWRRNPIRFVRASISLTISIIYLTVMDVLTFSHGSLFGVPLWLPIALGIMAVTIKHKKDATYEEKEKPKG